MCVSESSHVINQVNLTMPDDLMTYHDLVLMSRDNANGTHGTLRVVNKVSLEQVDHPAKGYEGDVKITVEATQMLMDRLWVLGYRPTRGKLIFIDQVASPLDMIRMWWNDVTRKLRDEMQGLS